MRIGIFADVHGHIDHLRVAVAEFNRRGCELVLFAGDLVSTFCVPYLRELACPLVGCFGDNEGNRTGLTAGMRIVGPLGTPPFGLRTADGRRILLTHQLELLRRDYAGADVVVYAHTHRPRVVRDDAGRLFINPGETSGWTYRRPTVAILETAPLDARIVPLPAMPDAPRRRINGSRQFR